MNPAQKNPISRPVIAIALAAVVAALMLAAAWFKQAAPAGSTVEGVLDGAILTLAVLGMFIPLLALPRRSVER
jgi:hypothetical protein